MEAFQPIPAKSKVNDKLAQRIALVNEVIVRLDLDRVQTLNLNWAALGTEVVPVLTVTNFNKD